MRIVGDISHPTLKITLFLHDSKYSVKFESGLYELTYKFRSGDVIDSVEAIKAIVDAQFIAEATEMLPKMHQQKLGGIGRFIAGKEEEEFEEII